MKNKKHIALVAILFIFALSTWALAAEGDASGSASVSSTPSQTSVSSAVEGEGTGDPFSDVGWLLLTGAAAAGFVAAVVLGVKRKKAGK